MHIGKIKSLDRPQKISWTLKNKNGINIVVAPNGWGKTHLIESIMHCWVSPSAINLPYRAEAELANGTPVVIGTRDQSAHSLGFKSSIETGRDAIMLYPGRHRRSIHNDQKFGYALREASAPLVDMKIGMQKSIMLIDDVDFGLDLKNAAEYIGMLHHSASSKHNQIVATTCRRELCNFLDSEWCFVIPDGWDNFTSNLNELMKVSS